MCLNLTKDLYNILNPSAGTISETDLTTEHYKRQHFTFKSIKIFLIMLFKSIPDHTTAYPAYTAAMGAGGVAESHQPNYIACLVINTSSQKLCV